jgi:hypothetical protein
MKNIASIEYYEESENIVDGHVLEIELITTREVENESRDKSS